MEQKDLKSKNLLLRGFPQKDWELVHLYAKEVELKTGSILYEPGIKIQYVYFPINSIIAIQHVLENGSTAEVCSVGNEGMVGVSVILGGGASSNRAIVQNAGSAIQIKSCDLLNVFNNSIPVAHLLFHFTQAKITQMSQIAVCNRHHSIEQQLSRLLLSSLDRLFGNELTITQEVIGSLLGVRRESVTDAAHRLQHEGYISYVRGHITILNRAALEKRTCECYGVVKKEYERLLPEKIAA